MRGKKAHSSGKSCLCTFKKLDAFLGLNRVCIIVEFSEITGPGILMKNYSIFQGHSFDIYLCLDYIYLLTNSKLWLEYILNFIRTPHLRER